MKKEDKSKNVVKLTPVDMAIATYEDKSKEGFYVYALEYHVESTNIETHHKFMELAKKCGLFDWQEGDDAYGYLHTSGDAKETVSWLESLCVFAKQVKQYNIDVEFELVALLLANSKAIVKVDGSQVAQCTKSETDKIATSYLWALRKAILSSGNIVKSKTEGNNIYNIGVYKDRFKIGIGKPSIEKPNH